MINLAKGEKPKYRVLDKCAVVDNTGHVVYNAKDWKEADQWRAMQSRPDWVIKHYTTRGDLVDLFNDITLY